MANERLITVAVAQYEVEFIGAWSRFVDKITGMVDAACTQGADLLVFPEYACLELASLFPAEIRQDTRSQFPLLQELLPAYRQLHADLASRYGIHLVASSIPVRMDDGSYRNRAYFAHPDGRLEHQDKLMMTRFESEEWFIQPGDEIKVFDTPFGRLGINICYDSEFPLIARTQVEAGADLILVPTNTDTLAGYHRVRTGSRARALENQCYVAMAPVVGVAEWSDALDVNIGAAGFFTPIDYGFPADGVLVEGELNRHALLTQTLDLGRIAQVRATGQVFNYRDWSRQFELTPPQAPNWLVPALVTSMAGVHHRTPTQE